MDGETGQENELLERIEVGLELSAEVSTVAVGVTPESVLSEHAVGVF